MDPEMLEQLRAEAADGDRELEAIIRLSRPEVDIPGVRIIARFGTVVTCRVRAADVIGVRARPEVVSIKAARLLRPGPAIDWPATESEPISTDIGASDIRRPPGVGLTGAGVVVASVDWGVDVDSAAFKWPADAAGHHPGGTRFLAFWDQRDAAKGPRPDPYGYGAIHDRAAIDHALLGFRPYADLGYHPSIADSRKAGSHGTAVLDTAAGNGLAGGPVGLASEADLVFVHLADEKSGGLANFGDLVRLVEAVDFISRTAGDQPCVINISAGRVCGPKDGSSLVERAFDELLASTPGRFVVDSAGNYFHWRTHSRGTVGPGETRSLTMVVDPGDITLNEVEVWYSGADEFAVRVDPPGSAGAGWVRLGDRAEISAKGKVIGRIYHRQHDPNNGDNHIVAYLDPVGNPGNWTISLQGRRVQYGQFHAWIERDDACRGCQARFTPADARTDTTIGAITTSHLPLIVGAYNAHDPARPLGDFSSAGPTRTLNRPKPDLVAPGSGVLAARSAPEGATRSVPGALTRKSGTSLATPHVTGAVALCYQAAGHLTATEVRDLVLGSCDPVGGPDPDVRLGQGYLNVTRLVARLSKPALPPAAREQVAAADAVAPGAEAPESMAAELLAAGPATAYREFLYRPGGDVARWVTARFDIVTLPGQRLATRPREGDVLLEVILGHLGTGRCLTLAAPDATRLAARASLTHGQLLLRPRQRVTMSDPLPVEPPLDPAAEGADTEPAIRAAEAGTEGTSVESAEAWRAWSDLIGLQVPRPVVAELTRRGIALPRIRDGWGDLNLDYYGVRISKMPSPHGRELTPEALLTHIRRNFDHFVDTNVSSFPPLDAALDGPRWQSDSPVGAVINISINDLSAFGLKPRGLYTDHGLVVCSDSRPHWWIFTTAANCSAGYHPITGNRMFGIVADPGGGWVIFTRGADRATMGIDWVGNIAGSIWSGGDALWRSFQRKAAAFVCDNHGSGTVLDPVSSRWPWKPIQSALGATPG